jgi:hypothetical protein
MRLDMWGRNQKLRASTAAKIAPEITATLPVRSVLGSMANLSLTYAILTNLATSAGMLEL